MTVTAANPRRTTVLTLSLSLLAAATLAACGSDDEPSDSGPLTVWSLENQSDRVQATQAIADRFTAETGIEVKIVGTDENQFTQLITSAAAAGEVPDVVGALSLGAVAQMASNELLDVEAAKDVVENLGEQTFAARALELTRQDGRQLAVPSDAWAQLLVYRKDLFDAAGLPAPDTFAEIEQAARTLHKPGLAGITMATVPNDAFTGQTFENFALGNGCELVDDGGEVTLDSQQCTQTFAFYGDLVSRYSVPGAQDVDTTRATYFAGKAAMVVWSSFILDELAGLRTDARPSCPQCAADPEFLARNSGIVAAVQGPSGSGPAQFGEITSWALTNGGRSEAARQFVTYMMNEGYADWFGVAPEGKVPVRKGTQEEPEKFATAWRTAPAGVDAKKPLGEVYPDELLTALATSPETFDRWGLPQNQGALVGATLGELPVPQAINALAGGEVDAAGAAEQAAEAVREIKKSLE